MEILLRDDAETGVTILTLNRPARRNALSLAMLEALLAQLRAIAGEERVRCVVIMANGPVFSAGHDLAEITAHRADPDGGAAAFRTLLDRCAEVMQAIPALPQPVIAAVQGVATAAGCQLAAAADIAIAAEDASFRTPGVEIGLFCSTPAVALSRAIGRKPALDMLLTGEPVGAEAARAMGLVSRVVPAPLLRAEAIRLAEGIAARSAVAIRLGKAGFRAQDAQPLREAYATAGAVMLENLLAGDAAEGISAFLAKRAPVWRDR
jgi:enoyl-CoA hydratase/carnithine racemase